MNSSPAASPSGSLLGSSLLVAGSCIGAGMLGLPVLTAAAGFIPSLLLFFLSWLFMVATGLLLLEVNLWFGDGAGLVTMAERTLGRWGKAATWVLFLFLFYSLLVAYVVANGQLVAEFSSAFFQLSLPDWSGSLLFVLLFGGLIYGGTSQVDWFNRLLMVGLIAAYGLLVAMGAKQVDGSHLTHREWGHAWFVVPPMIIGFGYHNLVPSLAHYLGQNRSRLVATIVVGTAIPLAIYLVWQWIILGIVPPASFDLSLEEGQMATQALRAAVGDHWVASVAEFFAFFALITSLLSVALSFVDFLSDGFAIDRESRRGRALLCLLTLAPPFAIALLFPGVFLAALSYAGAFGAVILFGILPVLMIWVGRYQRNYQQAVIVKGGKKMLLLILFFACLVVFLQSMRELGWV